MGQVSLFLTHQSSFCSLLPALHPTLDFDPQLFVLVLPALPSFPASPMGDSRPFTEPRGNPARSGAGIVSRIRLENFMCHSSLEVAFGDWVNFITGQNGSMRRSQFPSLLVLFIGIFRGFGVFLVGGKSAILTALCIAFGSRAKGTQRASSLKDFIKTGCRWITHLFS